MEVLTDAEIVELGFEPGWRGWQLTSGVAESIAAAAARTGPGSNTDPIPSLIPGSAQCVVCDEPAEASTCGTPTCSAICTAVLLERLVSDPALVDVHFTRGDGSGGTPAIRPPTPPTPKLRPISPDRPSIDRALERLGSCTEVLERHGHRVRGRMCFCPFHPNERTRAMSLYERNGKSRARCHSCAWAGDSLDLEAALAGEDLKTTIRRWS